MKKSIFALFVILIFMGCSKDDDESFNITFKKSELTNKNSTCGYFTYKDQTLCVSTMLLVDYDKEEYKYSASDSRCPNKNNHNKNSNISLKVGSPDFFDCEECKARFNPFTGNPINEEGKGYKLKIYKTSYDEESETYRVWK